MQGEVQWGHLVLHLAAVTAVGQCYACIYNMNWQVHRVGDISTPWPCFMLAAKASVITEKLGGIQAMLAALHEAAQLFHAEEMTMPKLVAYHGPKYLLLVLLLGAKYPPMLST